MFRDFIINCVASSCLMPRKLRRVIYTLYGMEIHTSRISPRCFMGGNKLSVGKNSFINYNNFFDLTDQISIGNNVRIAMCSRFITSSHEIGPAELRGGTGISAPIVIEDGCWIGADVTVLPGVRIGRGSIVAAGAVVVHDVEENTLVGGVPAKTIRKLETGKADE